MGIDVHHRTPTVASRTEYSVLGVATQLKRLLAPGAFTGMTVDGDRCVRALGPETRIKLRSDFREESGLPHFFAEDLLIPLPPRIAIDHSRNVKAQVAARTEPSSRRFAGRRESPDELRSESGAGLNAAPLVVAVGARRLKAPTHSDVPRLRGARVTAPVTHFHSAKRLHQGYIPTPGDSVQFCHSQDASASQSIWLLIA